MRHTILVHALMLAALHGVAPTDTNGQPYVIDYNRFSRIVEEIPFESAIQSFQVIDTRAYVVTGEQLLVFDVTDPLDLDLLGAFTPDLPISRLRVADGVAYYCDWPDRMVAVGVADPSAMIELSRLEVPDLGWLMAVSGQYLYFSSGDDINVVDVSNPSHPVFVDFFDFGLPGAPNIFNFAIRDGIACATLRYGGLMFLNVSDPTSIELIAYYTEYSNPTMPGYVSIVGDFVYHNAPGLDRHQGWIWNIQNPAEPQLAGELRGVYFWNLVEDGPGRMLGTSGGSGLVAYDIDDPTAPARLGGVYMDHQDYTSPAYRVGNYLLAVSESGLVVIEEGDMWGVPVLDRLDLDDVTIRLFEVHGDRGILSLDDGRLSVIDLSDPTALAVGTTLDVNTSGWVGLACRDDIAISVNLGLGMKVLDWSDPYDVHVVAELSPPYELVNVEIHGDLAYVVARDFGLLIYDLSTPSAPNLIGSWSFDPALDIEVGGIKVGDGVALLSWIRDDYMLVGNFLIDVHDPTAPTQGPDIEYLGFLWAIRDNILVTHRGPVCLYSIADPAHPELLSTLSFPSNNVNIVGFDGTDLYILVDYQLTVVDTNEPSSPTIIAEGTVTTNSWRGSISDVLCFATGPFLYAFPRHANDIVGVNEPGDDDLPDQDADGLMACYPNPFNPQLTVTFEVEGDGLIDLQIYDVRGRRVASLYRGTMATGRHTVTWPGQDDSGRAMPSGTYFVRVDSGERIITRKVVLAR
jgi:hypothetical protein